ncbi:hypothetical protein TNIN_388751 [Trichonephila inaurata madagascariensis]|uniref:Uncharacterized protein n=1 Tax=Trichonephila inaurata madagascariensis TaxID=2747483 RepID=A0A8X6M9U1_9ARAC|nr:hypothetical protein TNIN_388751 [Trichonephila inaurata madagascariensis]
MYRHSADSTVRHYNLRAKSFLINGEIWALFRICLHGVRGTPRRVGEISHGLPRESVPCRKPHLMYPIEASIAYPVSLHVLYPARLDYSFCRGASPTPSLTSLKLPAIRFAFRNTRATGFTSLSTPSYYSGTLDLEKE